MSPPTIRLLAGPTASGKSALALAWARERDALIINADSMQLYADLRVLTARPSAEEEAQAEHRLFGVADAAEGWSVGRWLAAAAAVLAEARSAGRAAVVVGGTGLYFRALARGLSPMPPVPAAVRAETRALLASEAEPAFRARLARLDPQAEARINTGDGQRLTRALEVALATGRPLSAWQGVAQPVLAPGDYEPLVLDPPRDVLARWIEARAVRMLVEGAVAEVAALLSRRLDPALPAMKALGVAPIAAHLAGEIRLDEARTRLAADTRRYAKRQGTWFRNQTPHWPRREDPSAPA